MFKAGLLFSFYETNKVYSINTEPTGLGAAPSAYYFNFAIKSLGYKKLKSSGAFKMPSFLFSVLQKEALMTQVAHQAVVMQFILEVASQSKQDPRGCFRQFFHKAKVSRINETNIGLFHAKYAPEQHCTSEKYFVAGRQKLITET